VRTGGFGARATTKGGAFRKAKNEIRRRKNKSQNPELELTDFVLSETKTAQSRAVSIL